MKPHGGDTEVDQDLGADAVFAAVDGQTQLQVGVDGVVALLLEVVGAQFVGQADTAALVAAQVDDDAGALVGDEPQRLVQLGPAVATQRSEDVAGQAFGVHPDEDVGLAHQIALHDGQMVFAVDAPTRRRIRRSRRTRWGCGPVRRCG